MVDSSAAAAPGDPVTPHPTNLPAVGLMNALISGTDVKPKVLR